MKSELAKQRQAAKNCTACPLYKQATQTVFGEGPENAKLMLVGEQPGDKEDLKGLPFVGPAGALIDHICEELKIDRAQVYVTNAVKHFKWRRSGKTRLHQKPSTGEMHACHPWLEAEMRAVKPRVVLCMGAVAAQSVLDRAVPITSSRGKTFTLPSVENCTVRVTWHPSAILRSPTPEGRAEKREQFKKDLQRAWKDSRK